MTLFWAMVIYAWFTAYQALLLHQHRILLYMALQ